MAVYHQMGHDSTNLLPEEHLKIYKGTILSPVNEDASSIKYIIEKRDSEEFELIFDPQLYYPNTKRGKLPLWTYFPEDVDTADQTSLRWWQSINKSLKKNLKNLKPNAVCSPAVVPRVYSVKYYELNCRIANDLKNELTGTDIGVIQTLIIRMEDLVESDRGAEIASLVSRGTINRVYLVFKTNVAPRRELCETEDIKGAMRLIRYLEDAGINVIVGFTSSDIILWKYAGAKDCASGKFFNLRRFTSSRWEEPPEGGGQLSYWFEESLIAYLRESDLIRVQNANFLSKTSMDNPYSIQILERINDEPGKAWLGISWRQYLYWFSDFEERYTKGEINADKFLKDIEDNWKELERKNILMEERQNDGSWLRAWRRAIIESF